MIVPQGGTESRPGTKFVSEVKDSSAKVRLIPFIFGTTQAYMLEFGNLYMRAYKDTDTTPVLEADVTISGITQDNPAVVTATGHNYSNGDQVYISGVVGMTEVNKSYVYYTVANKTANTFELQDRDGTNVDSTGFTAYSSGGVCNKVFTLTTPYTTAQLFELDYTQSADVLTITHGVHSVNNITRTADTTWTITATQKDADSGSTTLDLRDGPYLKENTTSTTMTLAGTGGTTNVTASAVTGINNDTGFQSTDVGRLFRWIDPAGDWHWYEITAVNSTVNVDITLQAPVDPDGSATPSAVTATKRWRLGAWSDTTGFPRYVTYHKGRRVYAGTATNPDTIWFSSVDDYQTFMPGTADDNAITIVPGGTTVDTIKWISSATRLRVGTDGGVYSIWGGTSSAALTPTSARDDIENYIRCKNVKPITLGDSTVFIDITGKKSHDLIYNYELEKLEAPDLTITSDEMLGDLGDTTDLGVTQMALQQTPIPTIWMVRADGKVAGLTYIKIEKIQGWHYHEFGGTGTVVESVATIPVAGQDRVWFSVKRTINGVTRRYIEKFDIAFRNRKIEDGVFLDSCIEDNGETFAYTLTPGALTGSAVTFTASGSCFSATDVGRYITDGTSVATIVGYTSPTVVTADVRIDFTSLSAIAAGSWSLSQITFSELDTLNGATVQVLNDGGTHGDVTVASNAGTLTSQTFKAKFGFGYTQEEETLDIERGFEGWPSFAARGKVNEVYLELHESGGGQLGYDSDNLEDITYRIGSSLMDRGVPAYTGQKRIPFKGGTQDSRKILIRSTDPMPLRILSRIAKCEVTENGG